METFAKDIMDKTTNELIRESLSKAMDYETYTQLVAEHAKNGSTTGPNQTESLINYTVLNDKRMKRWNKTLKISEEAKTKIALAEKEVTWLVLTESWCGDAAPTMPVMNKVAELNENVNLKIILRDEHTDLMNRFLTNEAMSIPKLIAFDEQNDNIIGSWGPRPSTATKMVTAYKEEHGKLTPEFKQDLQVWYNKDKGQDTVKDMLSLLSLK
ncbi:thioredoxin family protein [Spongiimicrobium sp. 3-5]|uniref:thioredoxin family protein n=1 Tax=Spongiimicrobium sp. 3-5 TaxID=3332596 RepID=UPI003980B603